MNSPVFTLALLLGSSVFVSPLRAQSAAPAADRIVGFWESESKDARMEVLRAGNRFVGKLLWGNQVVEADGKTFKKDVNNPDPKLRTRSLQNILFLTGLVYADGRWTDGNIYEAATGRTYSCRVELQSGRLALRGYVGLPVMGQTVRWNRLPK